LGGNATMAIVISGSVGQAGQSNQGGGIQTVAGWTLATLAANATVSVRNTGVTPVNTAAFTAGSAAPYAGELYIERVG
jgi:hypothetical protein